MGNKIKIFLLLIVCFSTISFAVTLDAVQAQLEEIKMNQEMQGALLDELISPESSGPKSKFGVNGFIEFRYENMDIKNGEYSTTNPNGSLVSYGLWKSQLPGQFAVRNLNLYFDFAYGDKVRSFAEVKLLNNPTADEEFLLDQRTVANDGNGSFISFGSIYIERGWIDYKITDAFKVKVGKFFTPYGIWNVEHGAPILPSIRVPATIAYGFMPNRQVGINLHGRKLISDWEVEYNAFLSNGRAVWGIENNENKGVGASFSITVPTKVLSRLNFGAAYYTGKEILDANQKFLIDSGQKNSDGDTLYTTYYDSIKNAAKEYCVALHLSTAYKKLELNAEYVYNNIEYDNANSIDNLNYRLFYRPDNASLSAGVAASYQTAMLPAYTALTTSLGLTDGTSLTTATATVNGALAGSLIDAATATSLLTAIGTAQAAGQSTVAGLKSITPTQGATLLSSKYGYGMPLNSLDVSRSGIYAILRYMVKDNFYPYFVYENANPGDNDVFPPIKIYIFGLNYKPLPVVTCKIEYSWQKFDNEALSTGYAASTGASQIAADRNEDFDYLQMSVSYAF